MWRGLHTALIIPAHRTRRNKWGACLVRYMTSVMFGCVFCEVSDLWYVLLVLSSRSHSLTRSLTHSLTHYSWSLTHSLTIHVHSLTHSSSPGSLAIHSVTGHAFIHRSYRSLAKIGTMKGAPVFWRPYISRDPRSAARLSLSWIPRLL